MSHHGNYFISNYLRSFKLHKSETDARLSYRSKRASEVVKSDSGKQTGLLTIHTREH